MSETNRRKFIGRGVTAAAAVTAVASKAKAQGAATKRVIYRNGKKPDKPALIQLVHSVIIFKVIQVDVALENLLHRGAHALELPLNRIENTLGVDRDISLLVVPNAGNKDQITVGDSAV